MFIAFVSPSLVLHGERLVSYHTRRLPWLPAFLYIYRYLYLSVFVDVVHQKKKRRERTDAYVLPRAVAPGVRRA